MIKALLLNVFLVLVAQASDEVSRPYDAEAYADALAIISATGGNRDPIQNDDGNCNGCSPTTSTSAACSDWDNIGIVWDDEGIGSFWNLFGAFSSNNICRGLSGRAEERIEEELDLSCGVNTNVCNTISRAYDTSKNIRECDDPSCFLFFLFCDIECSRISCIYDLKCPDVVSS